MVKMKPTREIYAGLRPSRRAILGAVATDRLDRTAFHGLLAEALFLRRLGLLINKRVSAIVVAFEVGGRSLTAEVAVDTLLIHVKLTGSVLGIFVGGVGHSLVEGAGS